MKSDKVTIFFNHVVKDYICGDIEKLLDLKLDIAGPLLNSVSAGIDVLGGMMDGFDQPSGDRSTRFLKKYLSLSDAEARLLYSLARCGMAHEGTTKLALSFFVCYERIDKGRILYRDAANGIWLNITELARSYLEVANRIAPNISAHLSHLPAPKLGDEKLYAQALEGINLNIEDFCSALSRTKEYEHFSGSGGPFQQEWLNKFTLAPSNSY